MDVVTEMLGEEPVLTQVVPPPSIVANMELAVVSIDQPEVIPPMAVNVLLIGVIWTFLLWGSGKPGIVFSI